MAKLELLLDNFVDLVLRFTLQFQNLLLKADLLVMRLELEESLGGLEDLEELLLVDLAESIDVGLFVVEHLSFFEDDLWDQRNGVLGAHLSSSNDFNDQIIVKLILLKCTPENPISIVEIVEHLICVQNV